MRSEWEKKERIGMKLECKAEREKKKATARSLMAEMRGMMIGGLE